jgi:hypothetical protein
MPRREKPQKTRRGPQVGVNLTLDKSSYLLVLQKGIFWQEKL